MLLGCFCGCVVVDDLGDAKTETHFLLEMAERSIFVDLLEMIKRNSVLLMLIYGANKKSQMVQFVIVGYEWHNVTSKLNLSNNQLVTRPL